MERPDHVLVVDDDAEIRRLLGEYLERNGFRVSLATDGKEMRRRLEQSRPDIVVLDLMLPGDSGLTLCRDLRAGSSLPVIMLTARAEEVDRVVDRNQLMDLTVGRDGTPLDRSIDVQVSRLRERLRDDAREPRIIKTVRSEGYVLAAAVERLNR